MLWKPYEARFDDFETKMKVHSRILDFTLTLHHIQISRKAVDREQLYMEEKELRRVLHDDRAARTQIVTDETKVALDLQQRSITLINVPLLSYSPILQQTKLFVTFNNG